MTIRDAILNGNQVALDQVLAALKTCEAELVTLKARLPEPYRSNVAACAKLAGEALKPR